ncbi:MAG: adenylate kinase family protein [Methanomicrobiales archaeon]|nr:adenylate kinase family protein [Methanomicrobiales archaeon]
MMCGITGTPGTGKSSAGDALQWHGCTVVRVKDTTGPYIIGTDADRKTAIIDEDRWASEFRIVDGFVEGLLAHYLPVDRIVVLRCDPHRLLKRLRARGYPEEKVLENAECEALDLILIETTERHPPAHILEIDTTDITAETVADRVIGFVSGTVPPSFGTIDWSDYLLEEKV